MTGAAISIPADNNKAFKKKWEVLELMDDEWALNYVKKRSS